MTEILLVIRTHITTTTETIYITTNSLPKTFQYILYRYGNTKDYVDYNSISDNACKHKNTSKLKIIIIDAGMVLLDAKIVDDASEISFLPEIRNNRVVHKIPMYKVYKNTVILGDLKPHFFKSKPTYPASPIFIWAHMPSLYALEILERNILEKIHTYVYSDSPKSIPKPLSKSDDIYNSKSSVNWYVIPSRSTNTSPITTTYPINNYNSKTKIVKHYESAPPTYNTSNNVSISEITAKINFDRNNKLPYFSNYDLIHLIYLNINNNNPSLIIKLTNLLLSRTKSPCYRAFAHYVLANYADFLAFSIYSEYECLMKCNIYCSYYLLRYITYILSGHQDVTSKLILEQLSKRPIREERKLFIIETNKLNIYSLLAKTGIDIQKHAEYCLLRCGYTELDIVWLQNFYVRTPKFKLLRQFTWTGVISCLFIHSHIIIAYKYENDIYIIIMNKEYVNIYSRIIQNPSLIFPKLFSNEIGHIGLFDDKAIISYLDINNKFMPLGSPIIIGPKNGIRYSYYVYGDIIFEKHSPFHYLNYKTNNSGSLDFWEYNIGTYYKIDTIASQEILLLSHDPFYRIMFLQNSRIVKITLPFIINEWKIIGIKYSISKSLFTVCMVSNQIITIAQFDEIEIL